MKNQPAIRKLLSALAVSAAAATGSAADSLTEALTTGTASFDVRARYEYASADELDSSHAPTIRTRLGYTTEEYRGLTALFEAEDVTALDSDGYNQAGLNPGGAGKVVIPDPETTEVNQAWIAYEGQYVLITGGRQRYVLDNARFVGDVGWRQNMQTFDAITASGNPVDALGLSYGYLSQINRVLGREHPAGVWDSKSHLFNARFKAAPEVTLTGFAYLLDFENAAANSSATYGLTIDGSWTVDAASGRKFKYRAGYAHQTDYGSQPLAFTAAYYVAEMSYSDPRYNGGIGYEVLGSDEGNKGFATPLATLHAFNGWADVFLGTPDPGLTDTYLWVGAKLPYELSGKLVYHDFRSDFGSTAYGSEWDVVLTRGFGSHWKTALKAAKFDGRNGYADVTKFWAQLEFNF